MKKVLFLAASATLLAALTGCCSLRTPLDGPRANNVYYSTFFGISIESLIYGDGLVVNQK